jgi:putative tricarboxylic transport membrane protein
MLEGLLIGLGAAFSFQNIVMVILGCLIGTFIGMLPGLGPMSIIAIMIPVAITIGDPSAALILLAGVYYGAIFGGSTSSILLNAPGVAGTVATSFDGYPMARRGQAGKALTVAAIASFAGGTIGAVLLMIFAPALSTVALLFHSAEYFALMIVGLSAIAAFAGSGNVAKAVLMTLLGLMMATVGEGALFNMPRFTMGLMDLQSGFSFITLAMAMFALPEAIFLVMNPARSVQGGNKNDIKDLRISREEGRQIAPVIGRQSIQGFFIGVLPGAGATIASFLGYAVERNLAPEKEQKEFINKNEVILKKLGRINNIFDDDLEKPAATMVVSGDLFKIYFDKDVDLKLIKENLTTKQSRLEQEMNKISQRLDNKSFVDRAPKEIVEQEKTNYNNLKNDIEKISVTIKGI